MSDGDFQREDRIYLPFIFEDEIIDPKQYLAWRAMEEDYGLEENMRNYGGYNMDISG